MTETSLQQANVTR